MNRTYEVLIVGGGVTGSAILYTLSAYTNIDKIALLEKYNDFGLVASHKDNNSQTLHFGDIETNYTIEKAATVKAAAGMVKAYVEKHAKHTFKKFPKMVLAVGAQEVAQLEQRYTQFKKLFPHLKKIGRKEIARIEPNVVKDRSPDEPILALYSTDGYAIDYGKLSQSFAQHAQQKNKHITLSLGTEVHTITRCGALYKAATNKGDFYAKVVVTAAAGHSLVFAYELGYGKDFILLPVAGSFFCAQNALNGKVYTMQLKKLPFAAVHGDPDVSNPQDTRFGPTAKVIPMLERHHYKSVKDFFRLFEFRWDAILSILHILSDFTILRYILKNILYDLPWIGKLFFLPNVKKIVPSIKARQLHLGCAIGGIRPQIVNTKTKTMAFGEAQIVGDNIIFNITPSPGASTCLQNAENDTNLIVTFLGKNYTFNKAQLTNDLKL